MDSKNTKCLHALRESGAERVVEAYKWVQDNSHLFNKEVYGPVLLEVRIISHMVIVMNGPLEVFVTLLIANPG